MKRRYAVAISAMILALPIADGVASAEPSIEQLETISALLDANDVRGLRGYLAANPELLEGTSPLASLLAEYMAESSDLVAFLGVPPLTTSDDDSRLEARLGEVRDALNPEPDNPVTNESPPVSAPDVSIY